MTHIPRFSRLAAAFLATTSLIPLLASCGGGGGSGPRTGNAATPVPTTSATSNSTCNNSTYAPNYASSVTLLHWQTFPISVFFKQDNQFTTARRNIAIAGFNRWVAATGNRADYTVVNSAANADLVVSFYRFTGGSGDTLGTTTVSYSGDNVIRSATMELGITGDESDDTLTAAHEYGHALGITGHSPTVADLMYFTGNLSGAVTTRDLNTAITAYCNNFNRITGRTSAAVGPLKTVVMH